MALLKTLAVMVSSSFAAVAGSLFAFYLSFINVESFVLEVSVQIIAMVIIGGTGTLLGPVIGAVIVLLLPALLTLSAVSAADRDRLDPADDLRPRDGAADDLPPLGPVGLRLGRPRTGCAMTGGEILFQADNISKRSAA